MSGLRFAVVGLAVVCILAGCQSRSRLAKIEGVVTLNGRPRPGLVVSLQPIGTQDNPDPGRGSSGVTDENGHFALRTDEGQEGAVVGKHRLRIFSEWSNSTGAFAATETGTPDGILGAQEKIVIDPIPPEWNSESQEEFEVPPEGNEEAKFKIVTRR